MDVFDGGLTGFIRERGWLKRFVRILVWPFDLILTLIALPAVLLGHRLVATSGTDSQDGSSGDPSALLFIKFGGGLQKQRERFGSLDHLANWDGPIESFDRTVWLMYRARRTGRKTVREGDVLAFEQRRILGIFHYLGWLVMVARGLWLTREYSVKLVRSKDPFLCGLCGWVIARWTDKPFAISIHTDYERRLPLDSKFYWRILGSLTVTRALVRFLFRRADRIFPIRESMIPWILDQGGAKQRVRVFPHGVDLSQFEPENLPERSHEWPDLDRWTVVSWAGRLDPDNYALDLAELSARLVSNHEDVFVLIAGDGEQREQMERIVRRANAENRVQFLGHIDQSLVRRLRWESLVALELNGGFSLLEAGAAGCALLAYDVEWHDEVVKTGQTGYLISEGDLDEAYRRLENLVEVPERARSMGERAQKLVRERFSKEVTARIKDYHYQELLEEYSEEPP